MMMRSERLDTVHVVRVVLLVFVWLLNPAQAGAQESEHGEQNKTAHEEFELGVKHFDDSQFAAASRAFLRADLKEPSSDALTNALVAAKKSGSHLLVVQVAERALEREDLDPGLVVEARAALAEATRYLARVKVSCAPEPCRIHVDEQIVERELVHLSPGTHELLATFGEVEEEQGEDLSRSVRLAPQLVAGSLYEFRLEPQVQAQPERAEETDPPGEGEAQNEQRQKRRHSQVNKAVLYGSIGVTAALAGLTTWSGLQAQKTSKDLDDPASSDDASQLRGQIRRTDVFLGTSIAAALFTVGWGIFATDIGRPRAEVALQGLTIKGKVTF